MIRLLRLFSGLLLAVAVSACVSGSNTPSEPIKIPAPPEGKARIVVYRTDPMGVIVQPAVKIDGTKRGICAPNTTFSVDLDPGAHEVAAATVGGTRVKLNLKAGQTVFISCRIGMGIVIGIPRLKVVPMGEGAAAVARLTGMGR